MNRSFVSRRLEARNQRILALLHELQRVAGLETSDWADWLELDRSECERVMRGERTVPLQALVGLAGGFRISLEAVARGEVDLQAAAAHFRGETTYIPARFRPAAYSRHRVALNFLSGLDHFFGERVREAALLRLQVPHEALQDVNGLINIRFFEDLTLNLRELGLSDSDFFAIGEFLSRTYKSSPIAPALHGLKDPMQVYQKQFTELQPVHGDNHLYWVHRAGKRSCVIESIPNPDVARELNGVVGNHGTCSYRGGLIAGTPGIIDLPHTRVEETSCIHRGDRACLYRVSW